MNERALFVAALGLGAWMGCAEPVPPESVDESAPEIAVTGVGSIAAEAVEGVGARSLGESVSAEGAQGLTTSADPLDGYRGPRIAIQASPDGLAPATPVRLTVQVTTAEGRRLELDETAAVTWRVPDGWAVEGEGATITLTPPDVLPTGELDVGVRVERRGEPPVRGGILLRSAS